MTNLYDEYCKDIVNKKLSKSILAVIFRQAYKEHASVTIIRKVNLHGALPADNKINITYKSTNICLQFYHKSLKNSILTQKICTFV